MQIHAKVKINFASKDEKDKILKLFQDAKGQIKQVPISEIFPSLVRFESNLNINDNFSGTRFDLDFDILGVDFDE